MNIEANKFYRLRDGRKAYIFSTEYPFPTPEPPLYYSIIGLIEGEDGPYSWKCSGRFYEGELPPDIVAEWKDPPSETERFWTAAREVLESNHDHAGVMSNLATKLGIGPEPAATPTVIEGWVLVCTQNGVRTRGEILFDTQEQAENFRLTAHKPDFWKVCKLVGDAS